LTSGFRRTLAASWFALCLTGISSKSPAQSGHRIYHIRNRFFIEETASGHKRPFDMWVTRMANALFDTRFTDRVIANLDDYLRYGVNTLVVGIQGGNLQTNKNHLYPGVYNSNGTLDLNSVVWGNLKRLLAETDRRGMALMVQYWYFLRDQNVPDDEKALDITRKATRWLLNTGHRNYLLDVVNEFGHNAYEVPGKPGVKRPLFTTLDGALRILKAVYTVDPDVIAGTSPPGGLASPEGWASVPLGHVWTEARLILGHNQISDPHNPASYQVGTKPADPDARPHVNNEFDQQLGSERYPKIDPRTQEYSYGHFEASAVTRYLSDLNKLRGLGAYGNVFSSRQQFIPPKGPIPDADVGPEGTQPEAGPGGGEGSMHWLFSAIAGMQKLGSLETRHDLENGIASGIELDLAGVWQVVGGVVRQDDTRIDPAWARMVTDGKDVEIAFDAAFRVDPGKDGRLGIQLGAPTPAGPAYRLMVGRDSIHLDQIGGSLPARTAPVPKNTDDRYRLRIQDGRVQVFSAGTKLLDEVDITPVQGRNLLFITKKASAAFDNLRTGPVRSTTFDSGTTGSWVAADPNTWKVVLRGGSMTDRMYEATVPAKGARHAGLDRILDDFMFGFEVDLTHATQAGFRFRLADVQNIWAEGYSLWVTRTGDVILERVPQGGPPVQIGSGKSSVRPASIRVRVVAEGNRIVVHLDGQKALEATDPNPPLLPGALSLIALEGKTRFDNLLVEGGPSRLPTPGFLKGTGNPLPVGFTVRFTDPDGLLDLARYTLEVDVGTGFLDISPFLTPTAGIFDRAATPDGKGVTFALKIHVPIGSLKVRIRAVAVDHAGNKGEAVVGYNLP